MSRNAAAEIISELLFKNYCLAGLLYSNIKFDRGIQMHFNVKNDKNYCYPELLKFNDELIKLCNSKFEERTETDLPLVVYLGLYPDN